MPFVTKVTIECVYELKRLLAECYLMYECYIRPIC